jgi:hypothetical protein
MQPLWVKSDVSSFLTKAETSRAKGLPACEMVLDIVGDLFTHGRQLKHLVFDDRIVSLLGKLPILGCLVPEIVSPIHVAQSNEPGS